MFSSVLAIFLSLFAAPSSPEEDRLYRTALRAVQDENWDEALLRMEHFVKYFPRSDLADNAVFWMAQVYLQKSEVTLAHEEARRLIQNFPKSERLSEAQKILENSGGTP